MAKISINLTSGDIQEEEIIVGIDLGTTNSLIARMVNGQAVAISDYGKDVIVPSVIHFEESGTFIVGEDARPFLVTDPEHTIFSIKRLMGKSFQDISHHSHYFGYQIIDQQDGLVKVQIRNKFYTPIELSAFILAELKIRAEHKLKTPVKSAVITVPAYFNDAQRQATRDAGKLAGLNVLRIINEPTAAALAYGISLENKEAKNIVVYDLGGGTFDITILHVDDDVFEVLSTHGDTYLGGDDIDREIVKYWLSVNSINENILHKNKEFTQALRLTAEKCKKTLSSDSHFSSIQIFQNQTIKLELSSAQLEEIMQPLVDRSLVCCEQALKDAKLQVSDIQEVILVGGSTRSPFIFKSVEKFFGRQPMNHLNPDEVVALGAAVQADILSGNRQDILLDVTPLSLGIETAGQLMDVLIPRNSKIPSWAARQYTTSVDGQVNMRIAVYQGERELVTENRKLGEFELKGIPAMPAGLPKVEIKFLIDADGILKVSATELRSGISQEVVLSPQFGLSDAVVEEMLLDSLKYAKEDIQLRMNIEAKEEARQILYVTEQFLIKNKHLLSADEIVETQIRMNKLMESLESNDKDSILKKIEALNEYTSAFAHRVMDEAIQHALGGKKILD